MRCATCGADLLPGKPFCPACGQRASVRCSSCGADIDPGFRFCPDCGAKLAAEPRRDEVATREDRLDRLSRFIPADLAAKIRASRELIAGERKLVTVLFCDLVGSTAIAERLDPEEYRDLLERVPRASRSARSTASRASSTSSPATALMALFGAPIAHEDAPDRAVLAALAIRDALAALDRAATRSGHRAAASRIGIHTGPVVVGTVGSDLKMDYTAIGDTTNLAARLESVAEPGTILISDATHRLGARLLRGARRGPLEVKGKSEPVARLRGARTTRRRDADGDRRGARPDAVRRPRRGAGAARTAASTGSPAALRAGGDDRRRRRQRQVAAPLRAQAAARRATPSSSSKAAARR